MKTKERRIRELEKEMIVLFRIVRELQNPPKYKKGTEIKYKDKTGVIYDIKSLTCYQGGFEGWDYDVYETNKGAVNFNVKFKVYESEIELL